MACKRDGRDAVELVIAETRAQHPVAGMICDLMIRGGMGGETSAEIRKVKLSSGRGGNGAVLDLAGTLIPRYGAGSGCN